MFQKSDSAGQYTDLIEGIAIRTLVYGEKTLTSQFRLDAGSSLPLHSHHHEQTGFLVSGKMEFEVEGETFLAEAGDSWCFEGEVEHGAKVLEDSVVIEVFSPVRDDYLPDVLAARREEQELS